MVLRLRSDGVLDSIDSEELRELVEVAVSRAVKQVISPEEHMARARRVLDVYRFFEGSVKEQSLALALTRIVFCGEEHE